VNLRVCASSSRANSIGARAGDAAQPAGSESAAVPPDLPFAPLATVTRISRPAIASPAAPSGMTAMSGTGRTENRGTTCSSIRFSPLKMVPS